MAGPLKFDHMALLIGLGTAPEVAKIVVDSSIPKAIVAGLGLKNQVNLSGSASGYLGARATSERQV